jgi:hypothetical protein
VILNNTSYVLAADSPRDALQDALFADGRVELHDESTSPETLLELLTANSEHSDQTGP